MCAEASVYIRETYVALPLKSKRSLSSLQLHVYMALFALHMYHLRLVT
jgi:hypothetical protein